MNDAGGTARDQFLAFCDDNMVDIDQGSQRPAFETMECRIEGFGISGGGTVTVHSNDTISYSLGYLVGDQINVSFIKRETDDKPYIELSTAPDMAALAAEDEDGHISVVVREKNRFAGVLSVEPERGHSIPLPAAEDPLRRHTDL